MTENFFGISDTGKMRDNNEDAFIAEKILDGRYIIACVIDGVGGYEGGEVAAKITRETILHYLSIPSGEVVTMMKEAFKVANEKIGQEKLKNSDYANMACVVTMALVDVKNKKFYYAHVGDTRLYLFRDNSLVKITNDHSFVGFLEDSGRLSEEEAMNHPKRNEINKALGFNQQISDEEFIETGESPFLAGDVLLLCSDGLTDMVSNREITTILSGNASLEIKSNELINAANKNGGKDNITSVLVQNTKKPLKQKATKPTVLKKNDQVENEQRVAIKDAVHETPAPPRRRSRGLIRFLTICCGLLLGALAWAFFKWRPMQNKQTSMVAQQLNQQEKKLADTINLFTTTTLLVTDSLFTQPVHLSDTLLIQNDSLYILGNGNFVIRPDSLYGGPGFMLGESCKYILLENLTFENFDVAILAQNKSLHLKNVKFRNCRVPVQYQFVFPDDKAVSGNFSETDFFVNDSLPNPQ